VWLLISEHFVAQRGDQEQVQLREEGAPFLAASFAAEAIGLDEIYGREETPTGGKRLGQAGRVGPFELVYTMVRVEFFKSRGGLRRKRIS